jgi:hypothetical protein
MVPNVLRYGTLCVEGLLDREWRRAEVRILLSHCMFFFRVVVFSFFYSFFFPPPVFLQPSFPFFTF